MKYYFTCQIYQFL